MSFTDFMLKKELMKAIGDFGFGFPFPVQQKAIPKALLGHDLICQAKSGMGKTAIFVLSTLNQIQPSLGVVDTLVLTHTREMATQIYGEFERFSKYQVDVKVSMVCGGIPFSESKRIITNEQPHIICGTPGRIIHLLESRVLSLKQLKRFIIDECDDMMELEKRRQLQIIFKQTPRCKQVMMFSATIQQEYRLTLRKFTRNPIEIFHDDTISLHGITQYYIQVTEKQKVKTLVQILDGLEFNQVAIFTKTKERASILNQLLSKIAFPSVCIHGDYCQTERFRQFEYFKQYKYRILVATNLFGRGIDLEKVNCVINYDMTQTTDEYLHRVGRVGRASTNGIAITFESNQEERKVMQQIQERFAIKVESLPQQTDKLTYASLLKYL